MATTDELPLFGASANTRVEYLIDQESGDWNLDLIHQSFIQDNATSILSIPLSRHKPQDRMIWTYTPKGYFTVNSAYKVAISMTRTLALVETSHDTEQTRFWRQLWNLHVPNKIKLFAWKACKKILPTKTNLYHRGVIDDPTCEACARAPKTVRHLFWECTITKDVWNLSDIPLDKTGINHRDFMDLLWYLLFKQHVDTKLVELVITTAWSAWFSCNKACLGEARQPLREIMLRALFSHLDTTGIGVTIQDHFGSVVATLSKRLPLPLAPLEAEAKALDEATIFTWDIGVRDVIFETNSTTVCHAMESPMDAPISISTIVLGLCSKLRDF
ncbi:uncharacterized protein LOC142624260 [Castanea sativa]|uniref:uncharacterized protein LOC142624260 n=1 Tax=Castanea sativa TaxID=21020 RepID=UPI003F64EF27